MTTMTTTTTTTAHTAPLYIPTATLLDNAHQALLQGAWGAARALLDDLSRRTDNVDTLCTIDTYMKCWGTPSHLRGELKALLGDRIDLVNAKALAR